MSEDVIGGVVLLVVSALGAMGGVAHWRGWRRQRGPVDPLSSAGRFYITWPIWAALGCFGAVILVDVLLDADWLGGALLVLMGVLFVVGAGVAIWQPQWFRPRWQRRYLELFRARQALIAGDRQCGQHLIVVLTVADDEEPITSTDDEETAIEVARQILAERPDGDVATVIDIRNERVVRTIARELT